MSQKSGIKDQADLNRNCLFRLLISIVSISITWISLKPDRARLARISHPRPPAPMTRILHVSRKKLLTYSIQHFMRCILELTRLLVDDWNSYCVASCKGRVGAWTWLFQHLVYMIVSAWPVSRMYCGCAFYDRGGHDLSEEFLYASERSGQASSFKPW
jgi:hypothetical protein